MLFLAANTDFTSFFPACFRLSWLLLVLVCHLLECQTFCVSKLYNNTQYYLQKILYSYECFVIAADLESSQDMGIIAVVSRLEVFVCLADIENRPRKVKSVVSPFSMQELTYSSHSTSCLLLGHNI